MYLKNFRLSNFLKAFSFLFAMSCLVMNAQTTALYPLDFVPHEETTTEISARETRLANAETAFFNGLNTAIANGKLTTWVNAYLPLIDLTANQVVYSTYYHQVALFELTKLATEYNLNSSELNNILIAKLKYVNSLSLSTYKVESNNDILSGDTGYPFDLNTVHVANSLLNSAICLKLLGAYNGQVKDSTEYFINTFIENKGSFTGSYLTTGYNKEIYLMDIGSNVLYLYKDETTRYPITKKTFESFWLGLTQNSYECDNSPHYDAGTGVWVALRIALLHNRLNDLKIRDDFRRILTRMAITVMNNGETAKWGKSMGGTLNNNTQLTNDGEVDLAWTLKMGYKLFAEPYNLYVARKYDDLRINGPITAWKSGNTIKNFPVGINFTEIKNVVPSLNIPLSHLTNRLTSKVAYNGLILGRGDTNTKLVQDKLILSTGHHPRAPYFLMDLSYTQTKAAPDHRIAVNNLMFDGTHLSTYLDRPGNGNQMSRPYLCPASYVYPLIPTKAGEVTPSSDYMTKVGFDPSFDYILKSQTAKNIDADVAYGAVEYSKFQYPGVSAKREVVLLHNGVTIILDRIKTDGSYAGGHKAGVAYQVWPTIQTKDINNRWVLQSNHIPTLVDKSANPNGFGTLYYFPQVGMTTQAAIATDTVRINSQLNKTYSVSKTISQNDSVNVLSMIFPIRNSSLVQSLINSIRTSENRGTYDITIPRDATSFITVKFEPNKEPIVNLNATSPFKEPNYYLYSGTDSNPWLNPGSGKVIQVTGSINKTLNSFLPNEVVWIAKGKYTVDGSINLANGVEIYGGFSGSETSLTSRELLDTDNGVIEPWEFKNSTTISGVGFSGAAVAYPIINSGINSYTLNGITLSGHNTTNDKGGAIYTNARPLIDKCIIRNMNQTGITPAYGGAGIYTDGAGGAYIYNCLIENCVSNNNGAAIYANRKATVKANIIRNNYASTVNVSKGGAIYISNGGDLTNTTSIVNNVIYNNTSAYQGGAISLAAYDAVGPLNVLNNTIVNNVANSSTGGIIGMRIGVAGTPGSIQKYYNNVIYNNFESTSTVKNLRTSTLMFGTIDLQYCAYNGGATIATGSAFATTGNLSTLTDPVFMKPSTTKGYNASMTNDVLTANFALQSNSPLINVGGGTNVLTDLPSNDLFGSDRPRGGAFDIGAYEYDQTIPTIIQDVLDSQKKNVFHINAKTIVSEIDGVIEVFSTSGNKILKQEVSIGSEISLESGFYIIRVSKGKNTAVICKVII